MLTRQVDKKKEPAIAGGLQINPGDFLLSHRVAPAVPSALRGLTSLFGMGRGETLSLWSPETSGRAFRPRTLKSA
jgi:hypothetical protein